MTKMPVYKFESCVRQPLAFRTAPRAIPPLLRNPCTKELATLQTPTAINSWVASHGLPFAASYVFN